MNVHLRRAHLLLEQERYELAENELRMALAEESGNAFAHTLLACCLRNQERFDDATAEAQLAIASDPMSAHGYHELALIMRDRNRLPEARAAVQEAIRLEPWEASHFAVQAAIEAKANDWKACLEAADRGLEQDPDSVMCGNLRSMALMTLGRRGEASEAATSALQRTPNNPVAHANEGWRQLHLRQPEKAMQHFQEALRLDPTSQYAQNGIIEAMKTRNIVYRWLFAFLLWTSRFPPRVQLMLAIGLLFGQRAMVALFQMIPALSPFAPVIGIAYVLFVWSTWCGSALFDLVLLTSSFGRLALPPDRKVKAKLIGGCVGLACVFLLSYAMQSGSDVFTLRYIMAMMFLGMTFPLITLFQQKRGTRKVVALAWSLALFAMIVTVNVREFLQPYRIRSIIADSLTDEQRSIIEKAEPDRSRWVDLDLPKLLGENPKIRKFEEDLSDQIVQLISSNQSLGIYCVYGIVLSTWGGSILALIPQKR